MLFFYFENFLIVFSLPLVQIWKLNIYIYICMVPFFLKKKKKRDGMENMESLRLVDNKKNMRI